MVLTEPGAWSGGRGPVIAARDLLDKSRIDLLSRIPDHETQWDWLVALQICVEYGLEEEKVVLDRYLDTLPSVTGKRAEEYVEAVRQGQREVRERVTYGKRARSESSGGAHDD